MVDAIQDFKREHPIEPRSITRVVIRGAPRIMEERHTGRAPQDVLGGQYSLPFTTAVALTRDMSNPLVYNDEALWDPVVRDLARRIELEPLDDARHEASVWPAEVLLECAGERHTLRTGVYKGSPRNPFTWGEVCEKFRRYTASILSAPRATAIVEAVGGIDQVPDMAEVVRRVAVT